MRYILVLFDAPVPATRALDALAAAGFTPAEVAVVPRLPGSRWPAGGAFIHLPAEETALAQQLYRMGIPAEEAEGYAEGVARGGILVAVRAPTLSVPIALGVLHAVGPTDLAAHRARWAADAAWRYDWVHHPPPTVDPPSVPARPPASTGLADRSAPTEVETAGPSG